MDILNPLHKLIRAVVIAEPADGPSLGDDPSKKWTWICDSLNFNFSSSDKKLNAFSLASLKDSYKIYYIFPDVDI